MNCRQVVKLLPEYSVGGLNARKRAEIAAHVAECDACRRELAALEATGRLMDALPASEPPRDLWSGIAEAIKAGNTRASRWKRWVSSGTTRRWAVVAAVAVLIIALAAGIMLYRFSAPLTLVEAPDPESVVYSEWYAGAAWNSALADRSGIALALAMTPDQEESVP